MVVEMVEVKVKVVEVVEVSLPALSYRQVRQLGLPGVEAEAAEEAEAKECQPAGHRRLRPLEVCPGGLKTLCWLNTRFRRKRIQVSGSRSQ